MTALVQYDAACKAIAAAVRVDEVKKIRDSAEAFKLYAKQAKNRDLEAKAAALRLRAERRLGEIMAEQKSQFGFARGGRPSAKTGSRTNPVSKPVTLAEAGIDKKLADRARKLAAVPAAEFDKMIGAFEKRIAEEGERVTVSLVAAGVRAEKKKARHGGMAEAGPLPGTQYEDIYMDPPTKFKAGETDRSAENHYPTLEYDQLLGLLRPLFEDAAAKKSRLWTWSTVPWLAQTLRLIEALGYEYKSVLCWDKEVAGTGYWFRNQCEILIVATRGGAAAPDRDKIKLASSILRERRTEHSVKPAAAREIIKRYFPGSKKLELFCRGAPAEGWDAWGNEAEDSKAKPTPEKQLETLRAIADGGNLIGLAGRRKLIADLRKRELITGKAKLALTPKGREELSRLADTAAYDTLLASLPGTWPELLADYRAAQKTLDEKVLASDAAGVKNAMALLEAMQHKAQGVKKGSWYQLRHGQGAPLGEAPLWGQEGRFHIEVDGVKAIVDVDPEGMIEVFAESGEEAFPWVEGSAQLESDGITRWTRGDFDAVNPAILGKSVRQFAEDAVRAAITKARGKKGDKPLPKPNEWYRMPKPNEHRPMKAGGESARERRMREEKEKLARASAKEREKKVGEKKPAAPKPALARKRGTKRRAKAKAKRGRRNQARRVKAKASPRKRAQA